MAKHNSDIFEQPSARDPQRGSSKCAYCAKEVYDDEAEDANHPTLRWHRGTCFRCGYCALPLVPGRPYVCSQEGALCMLCFADSRSHHADCSWQEDVTVHNRTRRVHFSSTAAQRLYSPNNSEIESFFCTAELPPSPIQPRQSVPHFSASVVQDASDSKGNRHFRSPPVDVLPSLNDETSQAEAFVNVDADLNASRSVFTEMSGDSEMDKHHSYYKDSGTEQSNGQGQGTREINEGQTGSCSISPISQTGSERPCPSGAEKQYTSSLCRVQLNNSGDFVSNPKLANNFPSGNRGESPCDDRPMEETMNDHKEEWEELALSDPIEVTRHSSPARTIRDVRTPSPLRYGCKSPRNSHKMAADTSPAGQFPSFTLERTPPAPNVRLETSGSAESIFEMNHRLEVSASGADFSAMNADLNGSRLEGSFQIARQKFLEATGRSIPTASKTQGLCESCNRPVFQLDRLQILNGLYHHSCFKCSKCLVHLTAANFLDKDGQAFCKRCYSQSAMSASYFPSPAYDIAAQPRDGSNVRGRTKTI
ncbi:putative protein-like [Tropilaelaps mercedesae]|uniref:LIM zinc-binding domain-containing protein n=1 Tax=Tropilaelaps mercedesae TaxID=418985 RepID=A0A1V9XB94_9ACAR|nr:putative protein-like [Tropilaelaps mercedesae]